MIPTNWATSKIYTGFKKEYDSFYFDIDDGDKEAARGAARDYGNQEFGSGWFEIYTIYDGDKAIGYEVVAVDY